MIEGGFIDAYGGLGFDWGYAPGFLLLWLWVKGFVDFWVTFKLPSA